MDSCTSDSTVDRTHHLLCPLRMRYGACVLELLQLPNRFLPSLCGISPRRQLGLAIPLRCRLSVIRLANVPQPRGELGVYIGRVSGAGMCSSAIVSVDIHLALSCLTYLRDTLPLADFSAFYLKGQKVRRMSKFAREADDMGQMMRKKAQGEKNRSSNA
jgi:hypothetical protein